MARPKKTPDPGAIAEDIRVGATIRALRTAHELRVGELAAALGISAPYMSNIEAGRKHAPMPLCRRAAQVLRVPLAAITIADYDQIREKTAQAEAAEAARQAEAPAA